MTERQPEVPNRIGVGMARKLARLAIVSAAATGLGCAMLAKKSPDAPTLDLDTFVYHAWVEGEADSR